MHWLWFFGGMMVGMIFGIFAIAIVSGNKEFDERIERDRRNDGPPRDYCD